MYDKSTMEEAVIDEVVMNGVVMSELRYNGWCHTIRSKSSH